MGLTNTTWRVSYSREPDGKQPLQSLDTDSESSLSALKHFQPGNYSGDVCKVPQEAKNELEVRRLKQGKCLGMSKGVP